MPGKGGKPIGGKSEALLSSKDRHQVLHSQLGETRGALQRFPEMALIFPLPTKEDTSVALVLQGSC